jgi:hypothetical protein
MTTRKTRTAAERLAGMDPTTPFQEQLDGDWLVTYHFGRTQQGTLAVQCLAIAPRDPAVSVVPGDGIISPLLGRVGLGRVRRRLRAVIDRPTGSLTGATNLSVTASGMLTATRAN